MRVGARKNGFRLFFQEKTGQGAGDGGHHQIPEEPAFKPVLPSRTQQGLKHVHPVLPEIGDQGHQGADVQEHVKGQPGFLNIEIMFQ